MSKVLKKQHQYKPAERSIVDSYHVEDDGTVTVHFNDASQEFHNLVWQLLGANITEITVQTEMLKARYVVPNL